MIAANIQAPLIVHIVHKLAIGGLENGLVNLINSMPETRYRHAIVCMAGYSDFAERIRNRNVAIIDLEKRPGKDLMHYSRLMDILKSLKPRIVHTRNIGTLHCQFVAAAAGVDYRIHGEHGWQISDLSGGSKRQIYLRKVSRTVVHRYMAVSAHMAGWMRSLVGIPENRISQIYNGVDVEAFSPTSERKAESGVGSSKTKAPLVIGTVGRLDPIKDHRTLIMAFSSLLACERNRNRDFRLVIVGSGEMHDSLKALVSELDLANRVLLTGASDDVSSVLRTFDLFVLPSLNEGISNTILEAMATGLPVVATSVGGNSELILPGQTGALFDPKDSEQLVAILQSYLHDSALREQHGRAGRERVITKFGMRQMVSDYLRMYDFDQRPSGRLVH